MKKNDQTESLFDLQIQNWIANSTLAEDQNVEVEVKYFTSLADIYKAISHKNVEHLALLSTESESIEQGFHAIKNILFEKQSVPLALFYKKESCEQLH